MFQISADFNSSCRSHSFLAVASKPTRLNDHVPVLIFVTPGLPISHLSTTNLALRSRDIGGFAAVSMSKLIIACLNIGTAGYFWHELPETSAGYFDKIEDLANPGVRIEIGGGFNLQRHWPGGEPGRKLIVLEELGFAGRPARPELGGYS
jgi:hypothetical protein